MASYQDSFDAGLRRRQMLGGDEETGVYGGGGTGYQATNLGPSGQTTSGYRGPTAMPGYQNQANQAYVENMGVDRPYSEYWMNQGKDTWADQQNWMGQRPEDFEDNTVAPPEWNQTAPEWGGVDEYNFDTSAWTGPDKLDPYQKASKAGQPSWGEAQSGYDKYLNQEQPGGPYQGWQDVGVDGFNADAAFEKYMQGANSKFKSTLYDQLDAQNQTAAGRGRLNSGFYNQDTGDLSRRLTGEARADADMHALDTNRQQLDYILGKADVGVKNQSGRADVWKTNQGINQDRATGYGSMLSNWMSTNQRGNEAGAQALQSDRTFAEGGAKTSWDNKFNLSKTKFDTQSAAYDKNYTASRDKRADYTGDRTWAKSISDDNYGRWGETRDYLADRSDAANQRGLDWRDRYKDTSTGLRQEKLGQEQADLERKQREKESKRNFWGGIIGSTLGVVGKVL